MFYPRHVHHHWIDITGPKLFPLGFADDSDPWSAAGADPWQSASRPASVAASSVMAASVVSSTESLSTRFARQNAETIAASMDLADLFRRHRQQRGPGGCPPPADEPGAGETSATRHDISTPSPTAQRRGLWRRQRDVATSPSMPGSQRVPDARYMAPELLPQHVQETADSTSFSQSAPFIPPSISVPLPYDPRHFHIKDANIFHEDIIFAENFEGIEDVKAARRFSRQKELASHEGKGGGVSLDFSRRREIVEHGGDGGDVVPGFFIEHITIEIIRIFI